MTAELHSTREPHPIALRDVPRSTLSDMVQTMLRNQDRKSVV